MHKRTPMVYLLIFFLALVSCSSRQTIKHQNTAEANAEIEQYKMQPDLSAGGRAAYAKERFHTTHSEVHIDYFSDTQDALSPNLINVNHQIFDSVIAKTRVVGQNHIEYLYSHPYSLQFFIDLKNSEIVKIRFLRCDLVLGKKKLDILKIPMFTLKYAWRNEIHGTGCCSKLEQDSLFERTKELHNVQIGENFIDSFVVNFKDIPIDIEMHDRLILTYSLEIVLNSGEHRILNAEANFLKKVW